MDDLHELFKFLMHETISMRPQRVQPNFFVNLIHNNNSIFESVNVGVTCKCTLMN